MCERIGNVKTSVYSYASKLIKPKGIIKSLDGQNPFASKGYAMFSADESDRPKVEAQVKAAIESEIRKGVIDPKLGMGFNILSGGYLNTTFWGSETFPIEPFNWVYEMQDREDVENGGRPLSESLKLLGVPAKGGSYCTHEARVLDFETSCWVKFLEHIKDLKTTDGKSALEKLKRIYMQTFMDEKWSNDFDTTAVKVMRF